ncbi:hypothetical protein DL796_01010 [Kangiella spongicola]|uniref:Uncharacterized protein n=1 Tax=Kangiella spongicola TaxID=796379 RepID=A0A318D7J1_9GAMM|nr:hypothetical protein DL796_01010 [Kangiella spongicola]
MLNKLAKLSLVSTALAPICLTLWFVEVSSVWQSSLPFADNLAAHWQAGSGYLLAALVLSGLCFGLVWLSFAPRSRAPASQNQIGQNR